MTKRSQIVLDLLKRGLVYGSQEFKRLYNSKLREKNKEQIKENWRRYYKKKMILTCGEWNNSRIKEWRQSNPGDWKVIQQRATKNGIHKRFYSNHKEQLKKEKAQYGKEKRRQDPFFGIKRDLDSRDPQRIKSAVKKLSSILNEIN